MKIKDKLILSLILIIFTTGVGITARRIIVGTGDIIHFNQVTRYGVSSMAGEGLVGTDTDLQYDSGLIYNKTEVDALIVAVDTGVEQITTTSPIDDDGSAEQPNIIIESGYTVPTDTEKGNYDLASDEVLSDSPNWDAAYTHIGESGASHTYIDQSVVSGSSPTFTGANFTAMDADDVNIADAGSKITATQVEGALQENRTAINLNTSKVTESTTVTSPLVLSTYDISIPAATNAAAGHATAAHITAIEANTAKNTNVPTALSTGTVNATTYGITSDGGSDDVVLEEANADSSGLLGAAKWAEIVANTAKATNVSTALSEGTRDDTTYGITSDGGVDDILLPQATTDYAGLLSGTKWDEIVANTVAKHTQNTDTDLDATFEATFVKKTDTVNVLSDITSVGADIEDAVTKKHAHTNSALLEGITADSTLDSGQKTALDLNTADRHASASDNQNLWEEIRTDTGTTSADSQTDTLWITGLGDMSTYSDGDTIFIAYEGSAGAGDMLKSTYDPNDDGKIAEAQLKLDIGTMILWKNTQFNAFRIGNYENMIDGFTNDFTVENQGIDTTLSDTYLYDATGDYYYQETQAASTTELDYMEYADDTDIQLAYVSSDTTGYSSDVLTGGTPSADTEYGEGYEADKACDDSEVTRWTSTWSDYPHWWKYDLGAAVTKIVIKLRIKPYWDDTNKTIKNFTLNGSNNDSDWVELTSDQHADNDSWEDYTFANSTAYRYYKIIFLDCWDVTKLYAGVFEIEMMESLPHLQCYSESTIITQGTYALKCIAVKDDSLADTIYHTFDPVIDLTGKTQIKLDTRATITGQNYSVKIHDSGGTTTTHAVTIADTSVYQTDTWDISGVSTANKDAIDKMIIEIDLADTPNTFYLDNVYGNLPATSGGNMELYTEYYQIGITPITVKAMILSNAQPDTVYLSRLGTGAVLTEATLSDSDIYNDTYYSWNYTADVSGEASDTCIRAEISQDDTTTHFYAISILGLE